MATRNKPLHLSMRIVMPANNSFELPSLRFAAQAERWVT
jgi:hypothetical protein